MTALTVDRVRGISGESLYRDYVEPCRPVIVEDACAAWPAHRSWTLENLIERFGNRPFTLDGRNSTLGDLLRAVANSTADAPAPYLRECYLGLTLPELLADVEPIPGDARNRLHSRQLPGMGTVRRSGSPELLVAGCGTQFPVLHYDTMHYHAFITQIRGSKRFWLYRPDQGRYLYPRADAPNLSQIDRFEPVDSTRWPNHAQAESVSVMVNPGETIFVPHGFWHRTQVREISIAVTWNAVSRCNWAAFIEDKYICHTRHSRAKTALKHLYFGALGAALRVRGA